jgi:hypothetical protein
LRRDIKSCSKENTVNISVRVGGILYLKVLIGAMQLYNQKEISFKSIVFNVEHDIALGALYQ